MEKMENCETHDSFQCELETYVRKQIARGLQPRLCFRSQVPEATAHPKRGHLGPKPLVLAQGSVPSWRLPRFPAPYGRLRPSQNQVHRWPAIGHSAQRQGFLNGPQRFHQLLASTWLPRPHGGVESWGCTSAQSLQDSTQPCWEEGRHLGGGNQKQEQKEQIEPKTKPQEEEETPRKRRRAKAESPRRHSRKRDLAKEKKRSHRKKKEPERDLWDEARKRDLAKEKKRSRRKKKEPERDLWDEAILGGGC